MSLEDDFERGRRIIVAECSRQTLQTVGPAPENDVSLNVFVSAPGVTKVRVSDEDRNCLAGVYV